MTGSVEVESKFILTRSDFELLKREGTVLASAGLLNVYYDYRGRLVDVASTFRLRFECGSEPVATLKIPISTDGAERRALEIEEQFPGRTAWRRVAVDCLPEAFGGQLDRLGIPELRRLGSMRTKRSLVELPGGSQMELDEVRLPDGSMLLEAEVEEGDAEKHAAAVDELKKLVPGARASGLSKFERFVKAIT